jgi:hypothetical protein
MMSVSIMQTLGNWSFVRVLLVSGAWILVCILAAGAWVLFQFRNVEVSSGSGGIGAVSFGLNVLLLLVPIAPPVVLIVAWLVARWF